MGAKKSRKVTLLFLAITDLICVLISGDSAVTIFEERCVPNRESMSVCHVLVVQKLSSRHFLVGDEHLYFHQFEFSRPKSPKYFTSLEVQKNNLAFQFSRLIFTVKFTNPENCIYLILA